MKKLNTNQRGSSAIEALLILVIIGLIGFVGWYVYSAKNETDKNLTANSSPEPIADSKVKLTKSFTSKYGQFTIKYPATWKLQAGEVTEHGQEANLTSPKGTVLRLNSDAGGRGGMCTPNDQDKPFQPRNACPTKEYLSADKVAIDNIYTSKEYEKSDGSFGFNYVPADIYLVTSHLTEPDGTAHYSIGLSDSHENAPFKLKDPQMGLFVTWEFFQVLDSTGELKSYIYPYATSQSKEFLQSEDANTIRAILKTLVVDVK